MMPRKSATDRQHNKAADRDVSAGANWRDILLIHPACELIPQLSGDELQKIGEDIQEHGLAFAPIIWCEPDDPTLADSKQRYSLLDGRSRLDAMARVKIPFKLRFVVREHCECWTLDLPPEYKLPGGPLPDPRIIHSSSGIDPYGFVASANVHRRHLSKEDREKVLIHIIARTPDKSDRQFGRELELDHKTIGEARAKGEQLGHIPPIGKRIGKDGKTRNLPKKTQKQKAKPKVPANESARPLTPHEPAIAFDPPPESQTSGEAAQRQENERRAKRLIDAALLDIRQNIVALPVEDQRVKLDELRTLVGEIEDRLPPAPAPSYNEEHPRLQAEAKQAIAAEMEGKRKASGKKLVWEAISNNLAKANFGRGQYVVDLAGGPPSYYAKFWLDRNAGSQTSEDGTEDKNIIHLGAFKTMATAKATCERDAQKRAEEEGSNDDPQRL